MTLHVLESLLLALDAEAMDDLYRHFLVDDMPEVKCFTLDRHNKLALSKRAVLFIPWCASFFVSTGELWFVVYAVFVLNRCQEDDCDEDFKPLAAEDEEEFEEAGVRSRTIQARELSDLLHDAFKQVTLLPLFSFGLNITQILRPTYQNTHNF